MHVSVCVSPSHQRNSAGRAHLFFPTLDGVLGSFDSREYLEVVVSSSLEVVGLSSLDLLGAKTVIAKTATPGLTLFVVVGFLVSRFA